MSKKAVEAFRAKVAQDAKLQAELKAVLAKNASILPLAKKHGFEFTADELKAFADGAELTDLELELVAGGTAIDCGNSNSTR